MTLRPAISLIMLTVLAGCGQPAGREAPPAPPAPVPAPAPAADAGAVTSLAGEWRVAGIDGQPFDEPIGLALSGDEQQIWWQPRCAGVARAYRIDGRAIAFRSTLPPRPAGSPPPPVCAIALPPRLDEVIRALDDASTIVRTPANGIEISGPDHSLTLFSQ